MERIMRARPQEELSLRDAITGNNPEFAETLIQFIQEKTPSLHSSIVHPSLESVDEHGNSFLMLSIIHKRDVIADKLFELQKNNDDILFGNNNNNESLIWQAAKSQKINLLIKIIAVTNAKHDPEGDLPWLFLETDKHKNSPLHASISPIKIKTSAFLLKMMAGKLTKDEFFAEINKTNLHGDTALHLAMKKKNMPLVAILVKAGADWELKNNESHSPFDDFCSSGLAEQNLLITELEDKQIEMREVSVPGGAKIN